MIRLWVWSAILALFVGNTASGHDLRGSDLLIDPSHSIETGEYLITLDYIPDWLMDRELRHFWPNILEGIDYSTYTLRNKVSGYQKTTLIEIEGGKEPSFEDFGYEEYCGVDVLLVSVKRPTPRYGGNAGRWLTTYIFRADTFEMLEEFTGTPYDVTRFDSRWVPEVDSIMDERYLVSCFPAGRGRPFGFGLIDRKRLYGPDWCGPGRARCRVDAPTP